MSPYCVPRVFFIVFSVVVVAAVLLDYLIYL